MTNLFIDCGGKYELENFISSDNSFAIFNSGDSSFIVCFTKVSGYENSALLMVARIFI